MAPVPTVRGIGAVPSSSFLSSTPDITENELDAQFGSRLMNGHAQVKVAQPEEWDCGEGGIEKGGIIMAMCDSKMN